MCQKAASFDLRTALKYPGNDCLSDLLPGKYLIECTKMLNVSNINPYSLYLAKFMEGAYFVKKFSRIILIHDHKVFCDRCFFV